MESPKGKMKKGGLIVKTWNRCKSIGRKNSIENLPPMKKSKSWPRMETSSSLQDDEKHRRKNRVAPDGCFSVYVGAEKQRFVIKTEYANHPLFIRLLEEAESEYGYNSEGPLVLPCNVDVFCKVLLEIDGEDHIRQGCGFSKGYGSYSLLSPNRLVAINHF